jgi:hypothetical protein
MAFMVAPAAARPEPVGADDDDDEKDDVKQQVVRQQHVFQEADFDRWIFQNNNEGLAGVRKRLESMVSLYMDDLDRTCKLTDAQKKRIHLAAEGDIKRFYVLYEKVRQKFLKVRHDQVKMQEIWQEINPLQVMVQTGIFDEDSFLFRSLHNALTSEQYALFDARVRERRTFRHHAQIELAVAMLELNVPLSETQRNEVIAALKKLTKPARKSGNYSYYVLMYQVSQLPYEKIKPLFDDAQWTAVHFQLNQYKGWRQWLKQSGQLADEDEDADTNEPAARKD